MPEHPPPRSPEAWEPAVRLTERLLRPLERFLQVESSGGIVLLAAVAVALGWANSPWAWSYELLWNTRIALAVGVVQFSEPLRFWVNDGLMTIFFFVVGLEIRREIHHGALADMRRATLPLAAALGGMIAPALIYLSLNAGDPAARRGWGVPTATDIAFAVGVLTLLGKRVPQPLRILLLALAIIDDIGAILIIALFYSSGVSSLGLVVAAAGVVGIVAFQRLQVRQPAYYLLPGAIVWAGLLRAGIHPTIGGVIVGLMTPVRPWLGRDGFLRAAEQALADLRGGTEDGRSGAHQSLRPLRRLRHAQREALPPDVAIQASLHPWVAYGIMPLFALANAGVPVDGGWTSGFGHISGGVIIGLVAGKPLGIMVASFTSVKLGLCALPQGVSWRAMAAMGCVAGIGFTMALFIANLAFAERELLAASKLAILLASAAAATVGLLVGRLALPRRSPDEALPH